MPSVTDPDRPGNDLSQTSLASARRRRKWGRWAMALVAVLVMLLALAPTLACNSPLIDSWVRSAGQKYGWQISTYGVQIGWFSSLRLDDVQATGPSGQTKISIKRIDTEITLLDLLGSASDLGTIELYQVRSELLVESGTSSLESDMAATLAVSQSDQTDTQSETAQASASSAMSINAQVVMREFQAILTDGPSGQQWSATVNHGQCDLAGGIVRAQITSTLNDPDGQTGDVTLKLNASSIASSGESMRVDADLINVPLSILKLVARRFPSSDGIVPDQVMGFASGQVQATVDASGSLRGDFRDLQFAQCGLLDCRLSAQPCHWGDATLAGGLLMTESQIQGLGLHIATEFGNADVNGSFSLASIAESSFGESTSDRNDRLGWLQAFGGNARIEFDLARFNQKAPGLLPLRQQATITSAMLRARIDGVEDASGFVTNIELESDPIRAVSESGTVQIEPMTLKLRARPQGDWIMAEHLQLRSMFATATAMGDLRNGEADFSIDLERLATMLSPLIDLSQTQLAGSAAGNIRWAAQNDNVWRLAGKATAAKLAIGLPDGHKLQEPSVELQIDALGAWGGDHLSSLNQASFKLRNASQSWDITLTDPIDAPSAETPYPIEAQGSGRLAGLISLVQPWLPESLTFADGQFEAGVDATISWDNSTVHRADIKLQRPVITWSGTQYSQSQLNVQFDGSLPQSLDTVAVRSLTLQGNAAALNARGDYRATGQSDLLVAWRADLQQLRNSSQQMLAQYQLTGAVAPEVSPPSEYLVNGVVQGQLALQCKDGKWSADVDAKADAVRVLYTEIDAAQVKAIGQTTPAQYQSLWAEPWVQIKGTAQLDAENWQSIRSENWQVKTNWMAATLSGACTLSDDGQYGIKVAGPAEFKNPELSKRLAEYLEMQIEMTGTSETPLEFQWASGGKDDAWDLAGSAVVTWDTAKIAGVDLSAGVVPVEVKGDEIKIKPSTIALDKGKLTVAATVGYLDEPMWIRIEPGKVAQGVQLQPQMTRTWLKYVAPLIADSTEVSGTFNVEIDEAMVYPDAIEKSKVSAWLGIDQAQVGPGPIANSIVELIGQFKSLTHGRNVSAGRTWIELPSQTCAFSLDRSIVTHQRLTMRMDDVSVITSGTATLDGRLQLNAQIPIEASWAGEDMKRIGMVGETLQIPIDGTFSRPSLDSRGVQQSLARLGTKAMEETARNALQKELSRGLQRIFGSGTR